MAIRHASRLHARRGGAMSSRIEQAFLHEWSPAADARRAGNLDQAFAHLERAHILGQRRTLLPMRSHRNARCRLAKAVAARGRRPTRPHRCGADVLAIVDASG